MSKYCARDFPPGSVLPAGVRPEDLVTSPGPFGMSVQLVSEEAVKLLLRKHADYGPNNIGRAPGGPLNGLAVRLHDKIARLAHLIDHMGQAEPKNESLRDTMLDIANYGIIGVLVLDGKWPGVPATHKATQGKGKQYCEAHEGSEAV